MSSEICNEIKFKNCSQLPKQIFFACDMISEAYYHLKRDTDTAAFIITTLNMHQVILKGWPLYQEINLRKGMVNKRAITSKLKNVKKNKKL